MSLDRGIEHGKEHRRPYYRRSSAVDRTCRPHGGCPYCAKRRLHATRRREAAADAQLEELR